MSHYVAIVAIPADTPADETDRAVEDAIATYSENAAHDCPRNESNDWEADCATCDAQWWDWWQVGGRWTGYFDGYDPHADLDNVEVCFICQGSGLRSDALGVATRQEHPGYTCNGCDGRGVALKWPTKWKAHNGDRVSREAALAKCTADGPPYRIVAGGTCVPRETFVYRSSDDFEFVQTEGFAELVLATIEQANNSDFVVVDYHS